MKSAKKSPNDEQTGNTTNYSDTIIPQSYLKNKYFLFPCKGKKPATAHGFKNASNAPEKIKTWARTGNYNIGLPTGSINNIWVLDIDKKSGGLDSLKELEELHGKIKTRTIRTGGGGLHFYFIHHEGIRNSAGVWAGVDIRGDGGYVIAPPSGHASGGKYEVITDIDPVCAPAWLIDLLEAMGKIKTQNKITEKVNNAIGKTTRYGKKALENQCANVRQAASGERNHTLNKAAYSIGRLIAGGEIDMTEAAAELEAAAVDAGLKMGEIKKTLTSGISSGEKDPKSAVKSDLDLFQSIDKIDNKNWRTVDYIDFYKKNGYSFKRNLLDDSLENNGDLFDEYGSSELQNITADSLKKKVTSERYHNIIMDAAGRNAYNPIHDYFNSIKAEDLNGSPIKTLSSFFQTNDDALFSIYLKKWLVGAVAKAYTGDQNAMLVLDGKQGIGKSQFAKWINPIKGFFHEGAIYPDSKDCLINLTKYFIWEVSELGATTRKADREALKDFITKEWLNFRAPYAKQNTSKKALSTFIGTINNEAGFLTDPSGNRRFNVITIKKIDWGYTKLNINEVWARAYNLYQNGFDYKLTFDEAKARDTLNGEYIYMTHVDSVLEENILITGDENDFITSLALTRALKAYDCKGTDDSINKKISSWMQRNEVEKIRIKIKGKKIRGFKGIKENFPVQVIDMRL